MKDVWQSIGTTIAAVSYKSTYPQYKRISVKNVKEETRKMKRLNEEEVKNYQLGILDTVTEFCEKNKIQYWLDCGTLLGSIRHKGYIPWDDDIDVGMLRPDFDRFMHKFNQENNRYKFTCNELDKACVYPYGKVMDTETILYEPDENGIVSCINIDVFVYDNAPDSISECKKMYDRSDWYSMLNALQNRMIGTHGVMKDIVKAVGFVALHLYPKGYFAQKIVSNSKKYADMPTKSVGNFTSVSRIICEKDVFSSFIKVPFEGREYNAPVGYDKWLNAFYGDYMQLPPEEKRVSHHMYKAYQK